MNRRILFWATMTAMLFPAVSLSAAETAAPAAVVELRLAEGFTDHMVLQREMNVPVWGTAAGGATVTVEFAGQRKTAVADAEGRWKVKLDPLKASAEPRELTVKTASSSLVCRDVLVGEVWLGSGQSNMATLVLEYTPRDTYLAYKAGKTWPNLRLLPRKDHNAPPSAWVVATPEINGKFSALLFSFGVSLQEKLGVPVGLISAANSMTPSGSWLTREMCLSDAACKAAIDKFAATYDYPAAKAKYDADIARYDQDYAAWKPLAEAARKEGRTPPAEPRRPWPAVVPAGEVSYGSYGYLYEWYVHIYAGYAIRGVLWDQGETGTKVVGVDQYTLMGALIKGWRKDWGQGDFPFLYIQKPNGGGAAWDYLDPVTALADKFTAPPAAVPTLHDPEYNHAVYQKIMNYPNMFMVPATDLGGGIHPQNKSGYGERAARTAMSVVYGDGKESIGPLYSGHKIEGNKVRIQFSHVGPGLTIRHSDKLQGFAVAGEDRRFVWADAVIEGNTVVLSSPQVPKPVAVRYAAIAGDNIWGMQFGWANLFSKDGLPAQPFQTDDWR